MIQDVVIGIGGTVETFFTGRRPGSVALQLTTSPGIVVVAAGVCTIDPVNTTLAAPAAAGALTLTLTSGANVQTRRRYLVGDEELTLKSVSGVTATLWAPLARAHGAGTAFQGLRVSYDVSALEAADPFWDGLAEFVPDIGDPQTEVVHCVARKIPNDLISEVDIRKIVPKDQMSYDNELDLFTAFRDARDKMLIEMGTTMRAQTLLGVDHFRQLAAHRFWLDRRLSFGPEWRQEMDRLLDDYKTLMGQVVGQAPVGATNGTAEPGPGAPPSAPSVDLELT